MIFLVVIDGLLSAPILLKKSLSIIVLSVIEFFSFSETESRILYYLGYGLNNATSDTYSADLKKLQSQAAGNA